MSVDFSKILIIELKSRKTNNREVAEVQPIVLAADIGCSLPVNDEKRSQIILYTRLFCNIMYSSSLFHIIFFIKHTL